MTRSSTATTSYSRAEAAMDLRTSRRPPAVPRALGEPHTDREAAVMAQLDVPVLPLELVRKLAWPRLEVFSVVCGLARSARLDTPRAAFARAGSGSESGPRWTWSGLPLGEVGERIVSRQEARLAVAGSLVEAIDAVAEPLWEELEPLWRGFIETERFATRAAFGLPEEDEPGQTERFASELMGLFSALPERARERLEGLVEGRPVRCARGQAARTSAGGELVDGAARCLLGALIDADGADGAERLDEVLGRVGARGVLEVLVGDHRAVSGRGGPRPTPAWLAEASRAR